MPIGADAEKLAATLQFFKLTEYTYIIALILFIISAQFAYAEVGPVTGLPLPRFVSLKSSDTNLRKGPNVRFPISWHYQRKGYPMMLVAEFENWRKLKDFDGSEGWVHENLITGTRNVMIIANKYKTKNTMYLERKAELIIFMHPDENSYPMARAQIGVLAKLKKCQKEWCKVKVENYSGWILKANLWGVGTEEVFD
jgi:SH3-like domain-containing protein